MRFDAIEINNNTIKVRFVGDNKIIDLVKKEVESVLSANKIIEYVSVSGQSSDFDRVIVVEVKSLPVEYVADLLRNHQ